MSDILVTKGESDEYYVRALHAGVRAGSIKMVRTCLRYADGDIVNTKLDELTPLMRAIKDRHARVARFLIDSGANPRCNIMMSSVVELGDDVVTEAVFSSCLARGETALKYLDVPSLAAHGQTECLKKELDLILPMLGKVLVAAGSSPAGSGCLQVLLGGVQKLKDTFTETLHVAIYCNRPDNVETILEALPVDLALRGHCTLLHAAARAVHGHSSVRILIKHNAPLNARNANGQTPLCVAIDVLNHEVAQILLEAGADANLSSTGLAGRSPLHIAARYADLEMVELLTKHGASLDARTEATGRTALHEAILDGVTRTQGFVHNHNHLQLCASLPRRQRNYRTDKRLGVVQFLLQEGADGNIRDSEGKTALHFISNSHDAPQPLLDTLLEHADINAADKEGRTPLHIAFTNGRKEVARALLAQGAHAHLVDAAGRTAEACYERDELDADIVQLLREATERVGQKTKAARP